MGDLAGHRGGEVGRGEGRRENRNRLGRISVGFATEQSGISPASGDKQARQQPRLLGSGLNVT